MLKYGADGIVLFLSPGIAHADEIDTNWCNKIAKYQRLDGPASKTPDSPAVKGRGSTAGIDLFMSFP